MNKKYATQIAELLNNRNELISEYDANKIIKFADNYEYILDKKDEVIAAVQFKKVQWYQWEISHLSVSHTHERKGLGTELVEKAVMKAIKKGARIIQCTIRANNEPSKRLFSICGFRHVSSFYYPYSGNEVEVWQKTVSFHPEIR